MAPRAYWSGHIRLSLVSIPVDVYAATTSSARISFRQIHEPSGKPVRYEKVVPGIGPVDTDDIMKGYEIDKDNYVLLSPEEIEDVKLESRKTLELVQFVDQCEIDPIYFDRPYFVAPQDELAEDAFRVLRDALRATGKAGIGQLAMRGKEHVVAVKPCGSGLLLETLRYEDELREADGYFKSISDEKADRELLELATDLIERKTAPFDASTFEDRYADALKELVAKKRKGKGRTVDVSGEEDERPSGENVVDLMAALKQSLKKGGKGAAKKKKASKSAARRKKSA